MNKENTKKLDIKNIVLRFGGVVAIQNISFDIFTGEIRAIIGPNGAGKSSMLNVINGFYHPQEGEVWFRGRKRGSMKPYQIAHQGSARTFQNIALFKGMTALDNIMTGRFTHMKKGIFSLSVSSHISGGFCSLSSCILLWFLMLLFLVHIIKLGVSPVGGV